jgi:hypothetical protein
VPISVREVALAAWRAAKGYPGRVLGTGFLLHLLDNGPGKVLDRLLLDDTKLAQVALLFGVSVTVVYCIGALVALVAALAAQGVWCRYVPALRDAVLGRAHEARPVSRRVWARVIVWNVVAALTWGVAVAAEAPARAVFGEVPGTVLSYTMELGAVLTLSLFCFVGHAVVLEGRGLFSAIARSFALTRTDPLRVMVIVTLGWSLPYLGLGLCCVGSFIGRALAEAMLTAAFLTATAGLPGANAPDRPAPAVTATD